jgi:hypothetical protein
MAAAYSAVEVTVVEKHGPKATVATRLDTAITALDTVTIIAILDGGEHWYIVAGTAA